MKKNICIIGILILLLGSLRASQGSSTAAQIQIDRILSQTGEYCQRLKKMAFDFVCKEDIKETNNIFNRKKVLIRIEASSALMDVTELSLRRTRNNSFIYDYQMIKKGDNIEEKRILLEETEEKGTKRMLNSKSKDTGRNFLSSGPSAF